MTTPGLDLRLLVPAGLAWALTVWALTWSSAVTGVIAVGLALVSTLLARRAVVDEALPCRQADRDDDVDCDDEDSHPRRPVGLVLAMVGAVAALLLGCTALHQATRGVGPLDELAQQRATATVTGSAAGDPRQISSRSPGGGALVVMRLAVREVQGRGQVGGAHATVLVIGGADLLSLSWRDPVQVSGRLKPSEPQDDVAAVLIARRPPTRLGSPDPLTGYVEGLRTDFRASTDHLPEDPRGLVPALVIGDTARLPEPLVEDMRATGMTHLTAVSGSNVATVLLATTWVCGWLGIPRRYRLACCLAALVLFVLLCRPEPSVIRASVMGVVGLLATSAGRPRAAAPALGAAVVVLVCLDPWLARSYGFALSVLATAGLILFARSWGQWFARFLPRRLEPLGEAIAIPVAAQAMCAPVVVLLQGSVSLVGIPANLLAAPLVASATLAGVVTVLLAPWLAPLATVTAWVAAVPTLGIATIAHVAAGVPFGTLPWPDGAVGALLLAGLTVALLWCAPWCVHQVRGHPFVAPSVVVLLLAAWVPLPGGGWPAQGWVYVACDVGQGDAGVLRTGPGTAVLVDAGPDAESVDGCLSRLGVTTLDAVVLTHFHADHVAGLSGALHSRKVAQVVVTSVREEADGAGRAGGGRGEEPSLEQPVRRLIEQQGLPIHEARAGESLRWGDVEARVLWPGRTIREGSVQNNASVALDVTVSGLRMLFLGDAEKEAQTQVLRALRDGGDARPFDVLKVAHHGSANHDPQLVRYVAASVGVLSVGADNDYGHPAPRTLTSLAQAGTPTVRTDRGGDIAVVERRGRLLVQRPP